MSEPLVTRFAPSPTGYLHLGHLAHMIYVWGAAEALGAKVLLRIEDHDRQRCRSEYEQAIIDDLDWLGFEPDNQLTRDYRQSDCDAIYRAALAKLDGVYRCVCSRKEIAAHSELGEGGERRYSGFCRDKGWPEDVAHGLRVRLDSEDEAFVDELLGPQLQNPARQCGDLLVRDRNGNWTYQFAVVVDDIRHGVNLVVRGQDLLASTGRQIQLTRLLGGGLKPRWIHHPLIANEDGAKMSKSERAPPIRDLRADGLGANAALGLAAGRVGMTADSKPIELAALAEIVGRALRRLRNDLP